MFKQALGSSESAPNNTKTSSSDSTSQDFFRWVSPWEIPLYFMGKMGSSEWENPWISSDVFSKTHPAMAEFPGLSAKVNFVGLVNGLI